MYSDHYEGGLITEVIALRMRTSVAGMVSLIVGDGASLEWQSYLCGHHAYCMLWTPAVG